ncbi:hypothetical protein [uncultured Jatrophihabitans sp.]|uniref:hypothetical protein n=1 Tax=uncultured Jatrophihabitans sp. TaxID=1610747 RepID=UPI0035CBDF2A
MTVVVLVETLLLAVLTVLVAGLLRAYGTVLQRLHQLDGGGSPDGARQFDLLPLARPMPPIGAAGPPAGSAAPEFGEAHDIAGETLDGQLVSARIADVEHDTVLLFLSSGCSSCEVFWAELARPVALPAGARLLVVPQSAQDESRADLAALAPPGVDVILSSEAWTDYEVPGSPHVVYVDGGTGRIRGEGTGQSLSQVSAMLTRSLGTDVGRPSESTADLRKSSRDAEDEARVDRELLAAGIAPGDPRLYGDD